MKVDKIDNGKKLKTKKEEVDEEDIFCQNCFKTLCIKNDDVIGYDGCKHVFCKKCSMDEPSYCRDCEVLKVLKSE